VRACTRKRRKPELHARLTQIADSGDAGVVEEDVDATVLLEHRSG
jgi:hypothetical protein